jgi:short-subunit dehydrogenase
MGSDQDCLNRDWTRYRVGLAGMGAELFLTYRDKARADETIAEIRQKTGNDKIHLLKADLGSQSQVRVAAAEFLATGKPLHVLINNAGLGNTTSEDQSPLKNR